MMLIAYFVSLVVCATLSIIASKFDGGKGVTVGDLVFATICSLIPFVNTVVAVLAAGWIIIHFLENNRWMDKEIFWKEKK